MQKTLKDIAEIIGGEIIGDAGVQITGVAGIKEAEDGDITFLANPKYAPLINTTRASAIIADYDCKAALKPIIRTQNPSLAFAKIISFFTPEEQIKPVSVHKSAVIGKGVSLGKNVGIGPYAVIEDEVSLGDNSTIYSGVFIGHHTKIGSCALIYPNVSIRERVSIGNNVIIHSGTVIGSDGFGYVAVEGKHRKIPQRGIVEIADDVEIGANVTIDRARFAKTIIGRGTKIDNLVHIAHNVTVGEDSLIIAQAGISGSTIIGNNVIIAGQAGLVGHIKIGDGAVLAAQAGVTKSVPENTMVSGYPARKHENALRVDACVQNLPKLYEEIKELKNKIEKLEAKSKNG
jgi:UDP-3-O-[3-hydroxymyristoyl] glucosamine N-acyltransferase